MRVGYVVVLDERGLLCGVGGSMCWWQEEVGSFVVVKVT